MSPEAQMWSPLARNPADSTEAPLITPAQTRKVSRRDGRPWAPSVASRCAAARSVLRRRKFSPAPMTVTPDIVVLQMLWNDLFPSPFEIVPLLRDISVDEQSTMHRSLRWLKRSRVLLFLRERAAALRNLVVPAFDWQHRQDIEAGRRTPYLEQAWTDVERSLAEFAALREEGIMPILLVLPIPTQVQSAEPPPTAFQQRVGAVAAKLGLRMVDALPAMREAYVTQSDLYIPWDHEHYTVHGHDVIAGLLHRYLTEHRLVP